jgi:hypothetical protein
MDKAALVSIDLQMGTEVLDILRRANLKVSVALWVYTSQYEEWRLVISGKAFDSLAIRAAYRLLHDTLDKGGMGIEGTDSIMILRTSDPFIKALRRQFAKSKFVEGMRLNGQSIGDRFVEEGFVYRIS